MIARSLEDSRNPLPVPPVHPAQNVRLPRQVSWLAGRCDCLGLPNALEASVAWKHDNHSPLTVAGAAPGSPFSSPDSLLACEVYETSQDRSGPDSAHVGCPASTRFEARSGAPIAA
jgi:hypothetical protein